MARTEFYCDNVIAGATNLNAGSTATGAASLTYAGGTFVRASRTFTVASGNPLTDGVVVGDFVSIYTTAGATVATYIGRVTARDATTVTVDATAIAGVATSVSEGAGAATLKVGGTWSGPSGAVAFPFNFVTAALKNTSSDLPRVNFKNGAVYNVTAAMTHSLPGPITFQGYSSSVSDGGYVEINGTTGAADTPFIVLTISGASNHFRHMTWNGNYNGSPTPGSGPGNWLIDISGAHTVFEEILVTGAWRMGIRNGGAGSSFFAVRAEICNEDDGSDTGGFGVTEESTYCYCWANHNGGASGTDSVGWDIATAAGEPAFLFCCGATKNRKHGFQVRGSGSHAFLMNCVADDNEDAGIFTTGTALSLLTAVNCILTNNGTYGAARNAANSDGMGGIINCFFFGNGTAQTNNFNTSFVRDSVTLTGDPFVDSVNGDYDLNNTAGAGAAVRGSGYSLFPPSDSYSGTMTSFPDGGASQHEESGGSTVSVAPRIMQVGGGGARPVY